MKLTPTLTTLAIALLALTACGSDQPESQSAEEAQQQYADELEAQGIDPMEPTNEDHNPMDGMGPMPAGQYEIYTNDGGHVTFDLPTDPSNDELTEIEQYRQDVQATDPVTYIIADVDNREGTNSIGMWKIKAFDEEGTEYEFTGVDEYISDTRPDMDWDTGDGDYVLQDGTPLPEAEGHELYNRSVDLSNAHLHGIDAAGRGNIVLVHEGDDLPNEFTRVAVWPNGAGEEVEAYPVN